MERDALTRADIFCYAKEHFGSEPEYLWARTPESAVLRHADNRKWYAIVMPVERAHLGLPGEGVFDVLNLKCDPALVGALRTRPGFLPAYHMNKERWITLLLDGPVSREEGFQLLEMSYELTKQKMKKASGKQKQP